MNIKITIASVAAAFALSAGFPGAAFAVNTLADGARIAHSAQPAQSTEMKAEACKSHTAGYRGIATDEVRSMGGAPC